MNTSHTTGNEGTTQREFFTSYGGAGPESYQRFFVPTIGAPLAEQLMEVAALRPGERVLDVACGTGVVARLAAEHVGPTGTVAGLDLNPGMLAVARSSTPASLSIEWHEASAERIPLRDGTFDVVTCQLGLQFVQDKPAALRELWRVLAPGGRVVLSVTGPTPEPFAILEEELRRHVSPHAAAFIALVFSIDDTDELERLIVDAGFRDVTIRAVPTTLRVAPPKEFLWQYVLSTPIAEFAARAGDEARGALERDVVAKWQPFVDEYGDFTIRPRIIVASADKK